MNTIPKKAARLGIWVTLGFLLGVVVGFAACIVLLIIVQARISYAQ